VVIHRRRPLATVKPPDGKRGHRKRPIGDGAESVLGDRIVLTALVGVRVVTLALAATETVGTSSFTHPAVVSLTLVALAGQSALTMGRAAVRVRRRRAVVFDDGMAAVEVVAGALALAAVTYATPPGLRVTSSYWVEPYTVISAVVIAGTARRLALGALGVAGITVTYLLCVIAWVPAGHHQPQAATATAWTNALSYLPFFAISAIGFQLIRSIVGQTEMLRRTLTRVAAERARVAAASSAYRIGHDIPKALLREVRRGDMPAEKLGPWAARYRDDLLAAVTTVPRPSVELAAELGSLTSTFTAVAALHVDLGGLQGEVPPRTPVLLLVEATRELLNNASYHRYGYPASLTARSSTSAVEVCVHNDGPGVDPLQMQSIWARKQNAVHQFEAAGGSYHIVSAPGSADGTTVTLAYPAESPTARGRTAPGRR
jgi:hypothetical protein